MKKFSHVIEAPQGLHARTAGKIAAAAMDCRSSVLVGFQGKKAQARDLIGLMGLYAARGDRLEVEISGEDEEDACRKMMEVMEENL